MDFSNSEITPIKVRGNNVDFSTIEITSKKEYVGTTRIFRPSKLHRKKYVETIWIFRPVKVRRKKCVETTCIFRSSKLNRKSTCKRRGNLSKFGLRRIHVISTSNRRGFSRVCPLGDVRIILLLQTNYKWQVVKRKAVVSELSKFILLY